MRAWEIIGILVLGLALSSSLLEHENIRARIVAAVGEAGARGLLDALTRLGAQRLTIDGVAEAQGAC